MDRRLALRLARKFNHLACRPRAKPPQPRLRISEHLRRETTPKKRPQHPVIVILVAEPRRILKKAAHADLLAPIRQKPGSKTSAKNR